MKGKVAIVTGAGSGIGRAIASLLAKEGAKVIVADISTRDGAETVRSIAREGGGAFFIEADVSRALSVKKLLAATIGKYGRLDILVNNAGVESVGSVVDIPEESWDRVIKINLKGTYLCSKYSIPKMIDGGGGVIVNVGSVLGLIGSRGEAAYCASKGGIMSLTRAMALDFAGSNIRVNCVCPGSVLTPTFKRVMEASGDYRTMFARNLEKIPLKRVAQPEEIAEAVLYLVSDRSSYVTGATLVIDGGWSAT